MAQHLHGHLTEKEVLFICKSYDNEVMLKFSKDSDGKFFNQRLEDEIIKRKNFSKSRSENRIGQKKTSSSYDPHMENENRDVNEDINGIENEITVWPTFEDFWNLYAYKVGRPKAEAKWQKIKQAERETIMTHVEAYVKSTPDLKYRKHPATYLNNLSWNDQIITNGQINKSQQHLASLAKAARGLG